jgi:hypothetical protein
MPANFQDCEAVSLHLRVLMLCRIVFLILIVMGSKLCLYLDFSALEIFKCDKLYRAECWPVKN